MAGGSSRIDDGKKKARIEIIPLIDVIFFLLATFVLFTLSLSRIISVPVNLPVAQTQATPPDKDDDMVTLQVTDAGTYFWNKEPIASTELESRLGSYKRSIAQPRVLISGDNRALFGPTVFALDKVRAVGIEQVSIETRVTDTGK